MSQINLNHESERISNGMKLPQSVEGLILAPGFASLILFLKLSCPASNGEGCFADFFIRMVFLPLPFIYKIFSSHPDIVGRHEVSYLLLYWALVGLVIGLIFDIHKKETH